MNPEKPRKMLFCLKTALNKENIHDYISEVSENGL